MKVGTGLLPLRTHEILQSILLVLLSCSVLFHRNFSTVYVIAYASLGILSGNFSPAYLKRILPFAFYYFLLMCGLLNSENQEEGGFELVKQLLILFLPLAFTLSGPIPARFIRLSLITFSGVIGLLFLYCFYSAWQVFNQTGEYKFLFYHELAAKAGLSALYFSMFLVLAILVMIQELFRPAVGRKSAFILYGLILLYVVFVIMLASRASILALFAIFCFSIYWFRKEKRALIFKFIFSLSVLAIVFATLFIPLLNQRFKEAINHENQFTLEKVGGGTSFRFAKWESAFKLAKENFWLGCGTGDVQDELNKQYLADGHPQILNLNAHNQYIQSFLGQGILGLISFLLCLYQLIRKPFRSYFSIGFVLIFGLCAFTESMLEVQKGILFFALFSSMILFSDEWMSG